MSIENYTMSSLTIGKRTYEVKECELKQVDLSFYVDNPRVYSALRSSGDETPSQEEIEKLMVGMEHVKQLRLSIESNGGLIDPLIVRDGDFVVLEGNSRLAAYRLLNRKDPIQWGMVKCKVLPADIDESAIFTLLGQYHIVGRKDWSPYEQAGYLYRRKKETKLPVDDMAKELGITVGVAKKYIEVYEFMIKQNDLVPEQWSYYEEFLKNKNIKKAVADTPEYGEKIIEQIKTNKISQASDIRKFGEIAGTNNKKSKKLIKEIVNDEINVYQAHEELEEDGSFDEMIKKLKKFRDYIAEDSFKNNYINANNKDEAKFLIKKIKKMLNDILDTD